MRRSVRNCTNGGVSDKKTTTVKATTATIRGKSTRTPKNTKHRSNKFNYIDTDDDTDDFLQINKNQINNNNTVITNNLNYKMPVYNIIARRHKV